MLKTKIAIVGYGYVGRAMGKFFSHAYETVVYDPELSKSFYMPSAPERGRWVKAEWEVNAADVGVVCVPTPQLPDGKCDTSLVEAVISWLSTPLIILKSTVEPGTTDRLRAMFPEKNIVFSPEYCGESSYWSPYKFHKEVIETPFFIFGGDPKDTTRAVSLYLPLGGPTKSYRQTSALAAETAKYMENCFYAMKVAFCYEMANICELNGVDWNEARELWLLDPRINPMHTAVFAENDRPFGGKCFPKDLSAMVRFAQAQGYDPTLLAEVMKTNERVGQYRAEKRKNVKQ